MNWSDVVKDKRWHWLINKNVPAKATFVYGVLTSKIYFDPLRPSRLPKADNIIFFNKEADAIKAGFRKSKRNGAVQEDTHLRHARAIKKACEHIDKNQYIVSLTELASSVGMSHYHFHRIFKEHTGVTPKEYIKSKKRVFVQENINKHISITEAVYNLLQLQQPHL
ncbi:methylphosphotriester-DNA--protein-cysteine methyltransferase family protein [Rouxiella badensis]|uniref:Ada metal-binding domain-containing protein n=1 Tax=Rouxiella badensis TaxID=1646377 RepID=UPI0013EF1B34|nr:Ada metal-binding domain-containing protein [Rouxiella badensis]QII38229.1 methylphosphotriester-DNA--protein-cysteine methyltransferase family protein [Rouxiella badensis]